MTQNGFSACKAEEWGVAVATSIDDNAADGNSGKSFGEMWMRQYTGPSDIGAFPYPFERLKYLKEYIKILEDFRCMKRNPRKYCISGGDTF